MRLRPSGRSRAAVGRLLEGYVGISAVFSTLAHITGQTLLGSSIRNCQRVGVNPGTFPRHCETSRPMASVST